MGRKKKENLLVKGDNKLIAELANVKWIKQPLIYTLLSGDFSLMQMNIIISISNALQERINDFLNRKKKGERGQLSLFTEEEIDKEAITFQIDFASLNIRPDAYDELEEACENLIRMNMSYPVYGDQKKIIERVYVNLFSRIVVPASKEYSNGKVYKYKGGKRRKGWIEITMLTKNLADVFDMSRGYVNHIATIAQICSKKRTPRIYIYLERWKNCGSKIVNYLEFKEYLGLLVWERKTNTIREDVYPKFSVFCTRVLEPVKQEMDELSKANLIDISFDYEPIYKSNRKRGNPDEIKFIIHLSSMGKMITQKSAVNKGLSDLLDHLKKEYGFTDSDLFFITEGFVNEMLPALECEVASLKEKEEKYKPLNRSGYVLACLKKCINACKPEVEDAEVIEEEASLQEKKNEKKSIVEPPSLEEIELFGKVLNLMNEKTKYKFTRLFNYLKLIGFDRKNPDQTVMCLAVPSMFFYSEIESNHVEVFRDSLYMYFPANIRVNYAIEPKYFQNVDENVPEGVILNV